MALRVEYLSHPATREKLEIAGVELPYPERPHEIYGNLAIKLSPRSDLEAVTGRIKKIFQEQERAAQVEMHDYGFDEYHPDKGGRVSAQYLFS